MRLLIFLLFSMGVLLRLSLLMISLVEIKGACVIL